MAYGQRMTDTEAPPGRALIDRRIGANVRAALAWRGMFAHRLIALLSLSSAAVSRRLAGIVPFTAAEIVIVAGLVDVPVGDLIERDPWAPPAATEAPDPN